MSRFPNNHTKGTWTTSTLNGRIVMAGATKVATANNTSPPPEAWRNAQLISAAPDMLEVLMKFMDFKDSDYVPNGLFERAAAAIAKATQ